MICQEHRAIQKNGDRCYSTDNWNVKGRENVISAFVNNLFTACGIVNGNVDSDTFNTWLEQILIPELSKNTVTVGQCIFS